VREGERHRVGSPVRGASDVRVDDVPAVTWDRAIADFADGSYEQTACHADGRWGARRVSHLALVREGVLVAGARVVLFGLPGLGGVAYVKFGPVWRRRDADAADDVYRAVVTALVDEYAARRGLCLTIVPRAHPSSMGRECAMLGDLGFVVRRPMLDPNRYLVDLTVPPAERLAALAQKWRYNLRQALRAGIECGVVDGEAGFRAFAAMHGRMVERKRFRNVDPLHLLPTLATGLPESMRPRVVLARHQGTPLAGAVVAVCGDTACFVFGASDAAALPLNVGYALQWWIVEWLAALGVEWYDLGGEAREPGLRQFKKGLVGKAGCVVTLAGEFDRWTSPAARLTADVIFGMRDVQRRLHALQAGR
jgi:hypothetical protein